MKASYFVEQENTFSALCCTWFGNKTFEEDFEASKKRACLSLVTRPSQEICMAIEQCVSNLSFQDPNHYYYPVSDLHFTLRNIATVPNAKDFNKQWIEPSKSIISEMAASSEPINVTFCGLLMFEKSIIAKGIIDYPFKLLRSALDTALGESPLNLPNASSARAVPIVYITVARFRNVVNQALLQSVLEYRDEIFGKMTIQEIELTKCDSLFSRDNRVICGIFPLKKLSRQH